MPLPPPRSDPLSVGARLLWSSVGSALAVLLALAAAHDYVLPRSRGSAGGSIWLEADFLCTLASSTAALGVGVWSSRAATSAGATAARSLTARVAIWAGLTLLFLGLWLEHVFLFALLIAPTHAFAGLRLIGLWSAWRTDVAWRRRS
ncbi:MAG TPA: hypothetical protein VNW92_28590 [Polyangiaceae bacterium]|jgi:hypothetical protein|nr:hypothetical protein [Polyangiaceae bacterium]